MERNCTKLNSPALRGQNISFSEYCYNIKGIRYLECVPQAKSVDVFGVCLRRRTERVFFETNAKDVSLLFWYSFKTIHIQNKQGVIIKHKALPSAGGRHAIDVLYIACKNDVWECSLYDDHAHALCLLHVSSQKIIDFIYKISLVLDPQFGDIIWFVSQDQKLSSKYKNAESLIWRDAGVVLGHLALVAEALELNFCPLGITGDDEIRELLDIPGRLSAVGGCIVGKKNFRKND